LASRRLMLGGLAALAVSGGAYAYWRHVWFFRHPLRVPPAAEGLVSPADGTVVYVKKVEPGADVVVIKQGLAATVRDLVREDSVRTKLVIGIFMSPFDVHYNRVPLDASVAFVRRYPSQGGNHHMGAMHWRTLLGIEPRYAGSTHIVQNERTVTSFEGSFKGAPLRYYVVQIGALTVNGIDSYVKPGQAIARGEVYGMIRIGSQVDLVVPWDDRFEVGVSPGDRVRAGETILVR